MQRLFCPMDQRLDGRQGEPHDVRNLPAAHLFEPAQDDGRPLIFRQGIDRPVEQTPPFLHFKVTMRIGGRHGFRGPFILRCCSRNHPAKPLHAPAPADMIQAAVDGDAVDPCRKLRVTAKSWKRIVHLYKHILGDVVGIIPISNEAVAQIAYPLLVRQDDGSEDGMVIGRRHGYPESGRHLDAACTHMRGGALYEETVRAGDSLRDRFHATRKKMPPEGGGEWMGLHYDCDSRRAASRMIVNSSMASRSFASRC